MKKLLLLLSCVALVHPAMAQFNRTYSYTLNGFSASCYNSLTDVANTYNSTATYCVLQQLKSSNTGLAQPTNFIGLKKMDNAGNVLFDKAYYLNSDTAIILPQRIVNTRDSGFLVVGMIYNTLMVNSLNPFLFKVDKAGNFLWCRVYTSSTDVWLYDGFLGGWQANIIRDEDDPVENYVISCQGGHAIPTGAGSHDIVLNVIKVTPTGVPIWNNKYVQHNRAAYTYNNLADYPAALTFFPGSTAGKSFYFIAGTRTENYGASYLFRLGLDDNGQIVSSYKYDPMLGYPFSQYAIHDNDPAENHLAMTYTMGSNSYGSGSSVSELVFMKLDHNLNILTNRYYWDPAFIENYGEGIRRTKDNNYIIGGFCSQIIQGISHVNPTEFKITKVGNPIYYRRYNKLSNNVFGNIVTAIDPTTAAESYILSGNSLGSLRMIGTTPTGDACGAETRQPEQNTFHFVDSTFPYDVYSSKDYVSINFSPVTVAVTFQDCNPANPVYKIANPVSGANASTVTIYPTLVSATSSNLTLDAQMATATQLNVFVYTMDGRIVTTQKFEVSANENNLSLQLPDIAPGAYIVTVSSADGAIHQTVRITKL